MPKSLTELLQEPPATEIELVVAELQDAIRCLTHAHPNEEGACWRIADALGRLGKLHPKASGISRYTGLGYKLNKKKG